MTLTQILQKIASVFATKTELTNGLNSKANSSHTHDYLPLSGGTLSGSILTSGNLYKTTDNSHLTLAGGTVYSNGSSLVLCGKGENDGNFALRSSNGTTAYTLSGSSTGSLTWNGDFTATTFNGNLVGSVTGNADSATKFSSSQKVALTGDVSGSASSTAGWSIATTLANSGVTAGSYGPTADVTGNNGTKISVPQITVDSKGRVTSIVNRTYTSVNSDTKYTFTNNAPTLAWGTTSTIGTVGGVNLTVKMPANPNTNTTYSAGTNMSLSGTTFSTSATPTFSNITVTNNSSNGILFGSYRIYVG